MSSNDNKEKNKRIGLNLKKFVPLSQEHIESITPLKPPTPEQAKIAKQMHRYAGDFYNSPEVFSRVKYFLFDEKNLTKTIDLWREIMERGMQGFANKIIELHERFPTELTEDGVGLLKIEIKAFAEQVNGYLKRNLLPRKESERRDFIASHDLDSIFDSEYINDLIEGAENRIDNLIISRDEEERGENVKKAGLVGGLGGAVQENLDSQESSRRRGRPRKLPVQGGEKKHISA